MKKSLLAMEDDEIHQGDQVVVELPQSDPILSDEHQDLVDLSDEAEQNTTKLERVDEALDTTDRIVEMREIVESTPEDQPPTAGGQAALAVAVEHMFDVLGAEYSKDARAVAMEGMAVDERQKRLKLGMETIGETIRKVGAAIAKIIRKIIDWVKMVWQKLTLSVGGMKKRLSALEKQKLDRFPGGVELKNGTLRNFFSFRGIDIESQDLVSAIASNLKASGKIWEVTAESAKKGTEATTMLLDHPEGLGGWTISSSGAKRTSDAYHEDRERLKQEFQGMLYTTIVENGTFTSTKSEFAGTRYIEKTMHMAFGNYVMRMNLMDTHQELNGKKAHPGKIGSSFGYDPNITEAKNRQPLLSLSSDDIHHLLPTLTGYIHEIEKVSGQIKTMESSLSKLQGRATRKVMASSSSIYDVHQESYLMALTYMHVLTKLVHGPVSGMSIYMLKSLFYSLTLAEKSVAAGATKSEFKQTHGEPEDMLA